MPALTTPIRLLLVEDHPMTLMGLRMVLEKESGFAVVGEATSGAEAIEAALKEPPDVILMDIGLPEVDGIEATQRIKKQHPSVKVLMLTSKDSANDVFAALAAGADAYCMKGIHTERLLEAIYAVNEGACWLDPAIARLVLGRFQQNLQQTGQMAAANASVDASASSAPKVLEPCPITPRELEVLKLIVEGLSNAEIAETLVITTATAKAHVHSILQKLCVDDRTQAAVLAMRQGYV